MRKLIDKTFDWMDKASPLKILIAAVVVMVIVCFVYGEMLDNMIGPVKTIW